MNKQIFKNYAFIDSQNLNLSIRDCGWILDYARFNVFLREKYKVVKSLLFIGYVPGNESLYTSLQEMGYIVIFKPTIQDKNGFIKGNCDAELVLHTMIEYSNYEKAVIITGDGDFHCLIEYLIQQDKLLKLGIPNKNKYSALLRRFSPYHFYINKLRHLLEYRK